MPELYIKLFIQIEKDSTYCILRKKYIGEEKRSIDFLGIFICKQYFEESSLLLSCLHGSVRADILNPGCWWEITQLSQDTAKCEIFHCKDIWLFVNSRRRQKSEKDFCAWQPHDWMIWKAMLCLEERMQKWHVISWLEARIRVFCRRQVLISPIK